MLLAKTTTPREFDPEPIQPLIISLPFSLLLIHKKGESGGCVSDVYLFLSTSITAIAATMTAMIIPADIARKY